MLSEENQSIIIAPEEAGLRLDKILANRYASEQSRTYFQYLIDEQLVLLNGVPVKKRTKPQVGDEIEVQFVLSPDIGLAPEPIPLEVLFEDHDLLIINKPAGMVVHPAPGNWTGTFVNALLHYCQSSSPYLAQMPKEQPDHLRPGIVHRLDKETSGLLIAAKTLSIQQKLVQMFAMRKIHKEYLAICIGNPGYVTIDAPIGRHPIHRKMMAVTDTGRQALTICRPLAVHGKLALVSIQLETGRTHQIRVHMKHQGTPILGDQVYGHAQTNKQLGVMRQMLHAQRISFDHPTTGQRLEVVAPLPDDMATLYNQFRL